MNTTTEIQDTDTQTFCDDCTGAMTPDDAGDWITCPNARDTCIDCCPCCVERIRDTDRHAGDRRGRR